MRESQNTERRPKKTTYVHALVLRENEVEVTQEFEELRGDLNGKRN